MKTTTLILLVCLSLSCNKQTITIEPLTTEKHTRDLMCYINNFTPTAYQFKYYSLTWQSVNQFMQHTNSTSIAIFNGYQNNDHVVIVAPIDNNGNIMNDKDFMLYDNYISSAVANNYIDAYDDDCVIGFKLPVNAIQPGKAIRCFNAVNNSGDRVVLYTTTANGIIKNGLPCPKACDGFTPSYLIQINQNNLYEQ